jgi:hypothetical protein
MTVRALLSAATHIAKEMSKAIIKLYKKVRPVPKPIADSQKPATFCGVGVAKLETGFIKKEASAAQTYARLH